MSDRAFDQSDYRRVLGHLPTGVCVITSVEADGRPVGLAVGSFTSVSLEPPLVAFFPDEKSSSWPRVERTGRFCANILASDQQDMCQRFATRAEDKFAGLAYRLSPLGSPILSEVAAWVDCTIDEVRPAGDHFIVLGHVRGLAAERSHQPLLFLHGGYGGFAPGADSAA